MSRSPIRVSEWALGELRKRAREEGRTVVSVVDRLLERPRVRNGDGTVTTATGERVWPNGAPPVDVTQIPSQAMRDVIARAREAIVCPLCGCALSIHQAGGSKERCERHPGCRWTP